MFITSSPKDQTLLSPDEEVREIEDEIRKYEYRDSISFFTRWAVRPLDLLQVINEIKPTFIHFSGHGSESAELVFQDDSGSTKLVSKEGIVQSISTSTEDVKMTFFSSCFTHSQAKEIVEYVDTTIGMIEEIGDDSAHELGHLLLHYKTEFTHLDKSGYKEMEKEANLFAGAFYNRKFLENWT